MLIKRDYKFWAFTVDSPMLFWFPVNSLFKTETFSQHTITNISNEWRLIYQETRPFNPLILQTSTCPERCTSPHVLKMHPDAPSPKNSAFGFWGPNGPEIRCPIRSRGSAKPLETALIPCFQIRHNPEEHLIRTRRVLIAKSKQCKLKAKFHWHLSFCALHSWLISLQGSIACAPFKRIKVNEISN